MPIYEVLCSEHGSQDVYYTVPTSVTQAPCPVCGRHSRRNWGAPFGYAPWKPYWTEGPLPEPVLVDSRQKEKEICQKTGFVRVK